MERSNRKRALDGGGGGASAKSPPPPPRKQAKVSFGDRDGREDRVNGAVGSAECQGHDVAERARSGRSDEVGRSRQVLDEYVKVESDVREDAGSGGAVGIFQRSQLAAKIGEQARELAWARGKIGEMEAVVTELDSAPMHAGYSLAAANEDMTVCLGQVGGTSEPAVVASTVLETDVSLAALESEAEKLRRLTKAVVQVVRAKLEIPAGVGEDSASVSGDGDASESVKDLHDRLRVAGDQLERYEARGREATLATDNLRDEMDDIRMLVDIRRRKIVRLELALREGRESLEESIRGAVANAVGREVGRENGGATGPGQGADNVVDQGGEDGRRRSSAVMCDKKSGEVDVGVGRSNSSGEDPAGQIPQLEKLAAQRLEELEAMQKEKIEVHLELSILQREVESRKAGILSEADVASCPIFKALEVELLQVSKMKITLEEDEKVMAEERAKERADAYSKHESVKVEAERSADESRKLVDDLRRVAESAKAEKDRWVMTYEARKMEANAAAGLVDACEKRAFVCEGMREKLKKTNVEMSEEVEDLRRRVREAELRAIGGAGSDELPGAKQLANRLEADLSAEGDKCAGFIEEIESLSVMFGDLEAENARLVKLLAEKDSVLSKVMGEKLRGRQQLATVKEEARSLAQGRDFDQEKIKNIGMQVSASKRAASESMAAASKSAEEVRLLSQQLAKAKKNSADATVAQQKSSDALEQVQKEREVLLKQAEDAKRLEEARSFDDNRLSEVNEELKAKLAGEVRLRKDSEARAAAAPNDADGKESLRDEIIQELMKKLHCSVCPNQPKEVALTRCGHMLSRQCVDQLVAQRSRKCPLCGLAFSSSDVLSVFLD